MLYNYACKLTKGLPFRGNRYKMDNKYDNLKSGAKSSLHDLQDDYAQQYRQQIRQYSEMDGTNYFNSNVDFEFEQYPYSQRPQHSQVQRQAAPRQAQRQPAARREYVHPKRNENQVKRVQSSKNQSQRYSQKQGSTAKQSYRKQHTAPKRSAQPIERYAAAPEAKGGAVSVKEEKKSSFLKKLIIIILFAVIIAFLLYNVLLIYFVSKVDIVPTGKRDNNIEAFMTDKNIKNILIIGSDTRDPNVNGRTDVMILLSVNSKKKEITMTSLMRDMYLPLVGYYNDGTNMYDDQAPDGLYRNKLNSAYVFGGPELLMDSIKYNFGIEVDDYIYIDFNSFVEIVDSIGGITMNVTAEEVEAMNECTREQNRLMGNPQTQDYLYKSGNIELNGNQTLSYARVRRVGNADFQRTQRQRIVIGKIAEKAADVGLIKKFSFAKALLSSLTTNMSRTDLFFYCYKAPFYLGYKIKELRIPDDGDYTFGIHNEQSTLDVDIDKCRKDLQEAIFD